MKLTYNQATRSGFVDNDTARGNFTQTLTFAFSFDVLWYDPAGGQCFRGVGYGREPLTAAQRAAVESAIPTISI